MERIISYDDLPQSKGQSIYLRIETDPRLLCSLIKKGYRIVDSINDANRSTIFVTGRRQDYECLTFEEYKKKVDRGIEGTLSEQNITKPNTYDFSYDDLVNHRYKVPFVMKNEFQNGGKEKFLILNDEDYENLISACRFLINKNMLLFPQANMNDVRYRIDYSKYLKLNFKIQEFIQCPSIYNTSVRLITTPSDDLLYATLKYNEKEPYIDDTTLLGYLLSKVYPLSSKSVVSNTLSGGKNLLLGEDNYNELETLLLSSHRINSDQFQQIIEASKSTHKKFSSELGIICGFDYIYDVDREKWFLLEYHSRPMVEDYTSRQGLPYNNEQDKLAADGRVRATALQLVLKKKKDEDPER